MKRIGVVAFVVAVLSAAAFGLTMGMTKSTVILRADDAPAAPVQIVHPNSLTYIGDDRLIVADEQGIKEINTKTGERTLRFNFGDFDFSYTRNIAFNKESNMLYMEGNYPLQDYLPDTVHPIYTYNEITGEAQKILDRTAIEAIHTQNVFDEEITDIIGQTMADVGFTPREPHADITVDKYNRTIWYINNTVYSYPIIIDETITAWWSFDDYQDDHYQWQTTDAIESGDNLFANTDPNTIIYEYPSAETPRAMPSAIPTGRSTVIMLNGDNAPVFGKNTADPKPFDGWRFVLYEIGDGKHETGYVSADKLDIIPTTNYQIEDLADDPRAKSVVKFKPKSNKLDSFYGRVIRPAVPIYKYPTCIINTLTVGTAKRTEYTGNSSLPLQYLISITDTLNWHYFQVEIQDADGNAVGVGFVPTNPIIDIAAESEFKRVVSNAEVVAADGDTVTIYKDAEGKEPLTEITLRNGAQIRIDMDRKSDTRYNRTAAYNKIYYNDPEIGEWWLIEGYIETKNIKPTQSSLSPAQWIGLSMLGVVLVGGLAAFIIVSVSNANYEKKKREMNALPPDEPEVTA